jgi:glycosyltransferase involved in cell wall biosynthesis
MVTTGRESVKQIILKCVTIAHMQLSVVVPAYNEARRLPTTLQRLHDYWQQQSNWSVEVIVVDDGSSDDTSNAVAALQFPEVQVLRQPHNAGKFAAFKRGVRAAQYEWVLLYDADGATPIAMLDNCLTPMTQYDLLVGSRRINRSNITVQQSLPRQLFGRLAYLMIRTLTGVALKDTQCGFKLCRTEIAKAAVAQMQIDRFAGDVEFIYLVQLLGGRVQEIPVDWHDVPISTVRPGDFFQSFRDVWKIRKRIRSGQYHR